MHEAAMFVRDFESRLRLACQHHQEIFKDAIQYAEEKNLGTEFLKILMKARVMDF